MAPEESTPKKPFDLADLGARFKKAGLPELEKDADTAIDVICDWLEEGVKLTPNPLDDFGMPAIEFVRKLGHDEAEKIDPNS